MKINKITKTIFLSLLLSPISVNAEEVSALAYDEVALFIKDYTKENKYSKEDLVEFFARTKIKKSIVKQSKNQPEVKLNWESYQNKVVTKAKVEGGIEFILDNMESLKRAENKYGVPKEIITSIIGIESFYGKYKGNNKALNAISTMAFEGSERRQTFFKKELNAYFDYCFDNNLDPLSLNSSWAGAFGYPQFIPSSIQAYAIDFNNDGKVDLINNVEDAIGSVANYLKKNGWKENHYIAEEVYNVNSNDFKMNTFKLNYTIQDLKDKDVKIERNMRNSKKLKLFTLETNDNTKYLVGYNNFLTITKYNRSNLYSMAVWDLANKIKGEEVK